MTLLKHVATVRVSNVDKKSYEGEQPVRLCNYTDVYYGDVLTPEGRDYMTATASVEQVRNFRLQAGDTVLTKDSETAEDIGVSAYIEESAPDFVCGYHLAVVRPDARIVDPKYLTWCMRSAAAREQLTVTATGVTRFGLRSEAIANMALDIPLQAEQRRIAGFLDDQVALLDRAITLRQRQMQLVRQASESRVERLVLGAGSDPPLVPAAFEPLGLVPSRWGQGRLRSVPCEVQTGPFGSQLHAGEYVENGWPIINPANLKVHGIVADPMMTVDDSTRHRLARHVVQTGDVIFGRRGELGRAAVVTKDQEGWLCGTGSLRVRFADAAFDPEYLARYLRITAVRYYFQRTSVGSTMDNLNTGILLGMPLLLPPIDEQRSIARECAAAAEGSHREIQLLAKSIELLQERKQALITAAVTGQFDVTTARGVA